MGRHKLLLDVGGTPVIARLVAALQAGGVDDVHMIVREDDVGLRSVASELPVVCHVVDHETPDMRSSVEHLLSRIELSAAPTDDDRWLLCPADHPVLDAGVIATLLRASQPQPHAILVPVHDGERGHPTLLPWPLARRVPTIPVGHGINWLVRNSGIPVVEIPVASRSVLLDLDTPEDYEHLQRE
jgi:CTP:molybdopterin cytidylyltransferase MocA